MPIFNDASKVYLGNKLIAQDKYGTKVYLLRSGQQTFQDLTSNVTWDAGDQLFKITVNNNVGDQVYVTYDGNEPQPDLSNVSIFYQCYYLSPGGSFVTLIGCQFKDSTRKSGIIIQV